MNSSAEDPTGLSRQIAEYRRLEARLRESEQRHRDFAFCTKGFEWECDSTGIITFVSERATGIIGFLPEEMAGRPCADFIHPDDLERMTAIIGGALTSGEPVIETIFRARTWDDRVVFLAANAIPVRDAEGRIVLWRGTHRDVTAQRQHEQALRLALQIVEEKNIELNQSETRLRASEERFRTLIENLDDFIWECDASLRHTFVSDNIAWITGRRPEELIGRLIHENIVPEERALFEKRLADLLAMKATRGKFTVTITNANNNRVVLAIRAVIHYSPNGTLERIIGIGSDVTERDVISRLLAHNERRFRELFANIATCVVIYLPTENGRNFIIRDFNLAAERTERIGRKEVLGRRVTEAFPGIEQTDILEIIRRVHRTGIPEFHPIARYHNERIESWREYYVFQLETGEIVTAYQDKTAEKKAEENLRRSEKRFRLLFEAMQTGFALHEIITDETGRPINYRFLDVNPAFEELTGLKRKAVVGRTVMEVMPGTEEFWIERYGRVALHNEHLHFENFSSVLRRWFDVVAFSPEPGRFATLLLDVTDRKKGEEMLFQNAKFAALGRITAGMAHELNQPLNAIKSFCQNIILNIRDKVAMSMEEISENLTYADDQVDRMAEIIQTMKSFASGGSEFDREFVELNDLASFALLAHKRKQIKERGGAFTIERSAAPCPVFVNPRRLQQVLINLIMNALDAVEGKKDGPPRIAIRFRRSEDGKEGIIEIRDNGPGIPAEIMDRIFEPFFTTKNPDKGTGLGLAISQDIVSKNGGTLECENLPDGGALFRVRLPLVEGGVRRDSEALAEGGSEGGGRGAEGGIGGEI